MNLQSRQIIDKIFKIAILTLIFSGLFFLLQSCSDDTGLLQDKKKLEKTNNYNEENFENVDIVPISYIGVAISVNIGTKGVNEISESNINSQVFQVSDFYINSNKLKDNLIGKNLAFTKEYFNILKIDFNNVLKKSKNRAKTLDNIIKQLKIRYKNANINQTTLNKQKEILLGEYNKNNSQIENLKRELEKEFTKGNKTQVFKIVDEYYILKNDQIILKTNIIFINEFLKRYKYLNNYNSILLDTLENNRDVISKNSYVVIPKSGEKMLKKFDLLFTEDEYKKLKTEKQ